MKGGRLEKRTISASADSKQALRPEDARDVSVIVERMKALRASGSKRSETDWLYDQCGIARQRLYWLLRTYLPRIAAELGAKSATYTSAWVEVVSRKVAGRFGPIECDRTLRNHPTSVGFKYE